MARSLIVRISPERGVVIDGLALLALTEGWARTARGVRPREGDGTAAKPLNLTSGKQWLWAIKNYKTIAQGSQLIYLNLAGRLIGGKPDCYVSDYGPVWRKGVDPVVQDPANGGTGVTSEEALAQWKKTQKSLDPSYQTIAQRVHNPALIFNTPEMAPKNDMPAPDVRTWTDVSRSRLLVASIRKMLEHESLQSSTEVMAAFRQYSRLQRLLPPLVGAMFLAEPARNIRAWPINMMLLDLVQAGSVFGPIGERLNWVNAIWHPLALNISRQTPAHSEDPVPGPAVYGPEDDKGTKRNMILVPRLGRLHLVGGAMPASPTGGGKFGKVEIGASSEKQLATFRKQRKFDYIHQKEIDVLLAWLARVVPNVQPGDEDPTITYDELVTPSNIKNEEVRVGVATAISIIAVRICTRIGTLDAM